MRGACFLFISMSDCVTLITKISKQLEEEGFAYVVPCVSSHHQTHEKNKHNDVSALSQKRNIKDWFWSIFAHPGESIFIPTLDEVQRMNNDAWKSFRYLHQLYAIDHQHYHTLENFVQFGGMKLHHIDAHRDNMKFLTQSFEVSEARVRALCVNTNETCPASPKQYKNRQKQPPLDGEALWCTPLKHYREKSLSMIHEHPMD